VKECQRLQRVTREKHLSYVSNGHEYVDHSQVLVLDNGERSEVAVDIELTQQRTTVGFLREAIVLQF